MLAKTLILTPLMQAGATALYYASSGGHLSVVEYLVEHGADFKVVDGSYLTPLDVAARNGHLEVVRYLVREGSKEENFSRYIQSAAEVEEGEISKKSFVRRYRSEEFERDRNKL